MGSEDSWPADGDCFRNQGWAIVPAAVNERDAAQALLEAGPPPRDLLAGKGFARTAFAASQAARGTAVLVPPSGTSGRPCRRQPCTAVTNRRDKGSAHHVCAGEALSYWLGRAVRGGAEPSAFRFSRRSFALDFRIFESPVTGGRSGPDG